MAAGKRPAGESRLLQTVYYAYVAGSAVARFIPERAAYALAKMLGLLASKRSRKRDVVAANLERITGKSLHGRERRRLLAATYESYARYWLETFRLVREGREFFLDRFRVEGEEHIDTVMSRGKGAVIVVGHLGNWDAAGAWVGATGRRLVTVAEVLRPRRMFDFFAAHRARLGMTIFPAASGATGRLVQAVEDGAVVAILGDRDLKGTGIEADFFGARATFPRGPAAVALATGVPLLVAGVYSHVFDDGRRGWRAFITPPIELPAPGTEDPAAELTQRYVAELEKFIAARPEEWHVLQPIARVDAARETS